MYILRRPFRAIDGPRHPGAAFRFFFLLLLFRPLFFCAAEETAPAPDLSGEQREEDPALELSMENLRRRIEHEAPAELIALKLGDSEVSLQMAGYWKGTLSANWGLSLSPLGAAAVSQDSPLLFQQEADLTLSLWIRERWFVEGSFLDDHKLNSYRAGYQGLPGETVQYVGLGNTGMEFPNFPYLDLGGDSPSSLGVYGRFGGGDLRLHTLIRYDLAALEERTFVGDRERTFSFIPLTQPLRGRSFALPDESLDAPPEVYLEDERGNLRDQKGRRWRVAAPSEYAAGAASGLVELGVSPAGMVAAAYSRGGNSRPWDISLGAYNTPAAPGAGFLGGVQAWFTGAELQKYPEPSGDGSAAASPRTITLSNGAVALALYEPGTFSPFERMSRYGAASSNSSSAALVRLSTGNRVSGYEVLPLEDNAVSPDIPLYAATEIQRGIYELVGTNFSPDRKKAENRWPLANIHPQIYLPGEGPFTGDLGIRFTNYGSAGGYVIGTDVVPGSVQVWRNGLQDPNIAYYPASGTVNLQNPAGFNELIRITYLKRSEELRSGSLAAGLGTVYDPEGPFSAELALGLRWNFSGEDYAESGALNPGTVGLGGKSSWEFDRLKARITGGFGFTQPDTTGLYRAAGMEGSEIVLNLPPETSFVSEAPGSSGASGPPLFSGLTLNNRSDLLYRNYQDTSILGTSTLMPIGWDGAVLVSGKSGPYPVRDPDLSSRVPALAAEFTLDSLKTWAGFETPLGNDGDFMETAREMEVGFRLYEFSETSPAEFRLILQIGALSDKDLGFTENPGLIVEKTLYHKIAAAPFDTSRRIVKFSLSDEERRKLRGAKYLRIFAVHSGTGEIRGRVLVVPPIVRGAGFRPVILDGTRVTDSSGFWGAGAVEAVERLETGSGRLEDRYGELLNRLHSGGQNQRVLELSWTGLGPGIAAGADGRIKALPLADYRKLSFFFKAPAASGSPASLRFLLARGPESLARREEISFETEIPLSAFQPGQWSRVEIYYRGEEKKVLVEGREIGAARQNYRNLAENAGEEENKSGYAAVFLVPGSGTALGDGAFFFDELLLEEPSPAYRLSGGGSLEWTRPGPALSYRGAVILSDLSFSAALESGIRGSPFMSEPEGTGAVASRSAGEASLFGARLKANAALSAAEGVFSWKESHGISRAWGPFSAEASFSTAPEDKTLNRRLGLALSGVFSSRLNGEVLYEDENLERKWNLLLDFAPRRNYIPAVSVESSAAWTENTLVPGKWMSNYGILWTRSWIPLIPDLGDGAAKRDARGLIKIAEKTSPLGAELSLEGSTSFSAPRGQTQSNSLVRLDIPLSFPSGTLNFRGERSFKRLLLFSGENVLAEGEKLAENIRDSLPLWKVFPLYSLFSPDLGSAMDEGLSRSPSAALAEYTAFYDRFGLSLRLPGLYDLRALFIPSNMTLRIDRVLEQKLDTRLDMLTLGGNFGFSVVNMFGAFGALSLFPFYLGDEFTHTLETTVAMPREEDISWRLQSSLTAAFLDFSGGELGFTNTFTAASPGWKESFVLAWTVPTQKSLLGVFYNWIRGAARTQSSWLAMRGLLNTRYEQLRKETLELGMDHSEDYLRWTLTAGHESIIRILGRLYFSVFVKLNCAQNQESRVLSFIGTAGTTLNVSF
jgi:hypothetical protein